MSSFSKYASAKSIRMCVCCRGRFAQAELYRFLAESINDTKKIIKPYTPQSYATKKDDTNEKGKKGEKKGKSFYFCKKCLQECLADEKQLKKGFAKAIRALPQNLGEIQEIAQEWLSK